MVRRSITVLATNIMNGSNEQNQSFSDISSPQPTFKLILNGEKIDEILNKKIDLLEWLMEKKREEEKEKEEMMLNHPPLPSSLHSPNPRPRPLPREATTITITGSSPFASKGAGNQAKALNPKYSSPLDKMRDLFKIENDRLLIDTLLTQVDNPKMTSQLFNYLRQDGNLPADLTKQCVDCLEYFMSKITLIPHEMDLSTSKPTLQHHIRQNTASEAEMKVAFKATDILAAVNIFTKKLFLVEGDRIVSCLMRICHQEAKGSFHHFRKIFQLAFIRCPDVNALMLKPCKRTFGQPPIITALSCIINSPVQDVLITYLFKVNSRTTSEQKESVSRDMELTRFLEEAFNLMLESETTDIVLNCFSVLKRMFLSAVRPPPPPQPSASLDLATPNPPSTPNQDQVEEDGLFLFSAPLVNPETSPLARLVDALWRKPELFHVELLHSILVSRGSALSELQNYLIPKLETRFQPLADILSSETSPIILKVLILDISTVLFTSLPKMSTKSDPAASFYTIFPWRALTDSFFERHSTCGIFLGRMCQLLKVFIETANMACLEHVSTAGFFDRLLDVYLEGRGGSDLYAHCAVCVAAMMTSQDGVAWRDMLSCQISRWDVCCGLAGDTNGLVFQLINSSIPEIASAPSRLKSAEDEEEAAAAVSNHKNDSDGSDIEISMQVESFEMDLQVDDCGQAQMIA